MCPLKIPKQRDRCHTGHNSEVKNEVKETKWKFQPDLHWK